METIIILGKIDLSIFDKPKKVKSPSFGSAEEQEAYEENYRLESESEDYWDSLNDYDEDDTSFLGEFAYQITDPNHIPVGSLLHKSLKEFDWDSFEKDLK